MCFYITHSYTIRLEVVLCGMKVLRVLISMILQIVFSFQKKNFSKRKSCRIEPHKPFQHSVNLRLFKKNSTQINHHQYPFIVCARSNHNTHLKNHLKQFLFGKYYIPSLLLYWNLRLKSQR